MIGRLHVITDQTIQTRFSHLDLAQRALDGGAEVIQFRHKPKMPGWARVRVAEALLRLCQPYGAQLIIDDHVDLAAIFGVGVHLGPDDLPINYANTLVKGEIGGTANDLAMATGPHMQYATYLGCGPVYGTASKGENPPPTLGVDGLAEVCAAVFQPVVAIGGITVERVPEVLAAGAHGVAVIGAVCLADDPQAATQALREALDRG